MSISSMSSREFNQNVSKAKKDAANGPVFITDRGKPAHVLLTIEQYQEILGDNQHALKMLSQPEGVADIEFDPPKLGNISRPEDIF